MREESRPNLYGHEYLSDQLRRARQDALDNKRRLEEAETAIRENSVVLLHLAAVAKDDTMRDLLQSVHDSLTDAL